MQEYRCQCGKLLFKGLMLVSLIEIKCLRCGTIQLINGMSSNFLGEDKYAFLYNEEGIILSASISANYILGYSPDELQKMSIYQINRCITPGLHKKFWNLRIHEGKISFARLFPLKKDGFVTPVMGEYKFFKQDDGIYYVFAMYQSIKAGDPSNFERPNFLQFGKNKEELFLEIDKNNVCVTIDSRVQKLLGYRQNELINRSFLEICKPTEMSVKKVQTLSSLQTSFEILRNRLLCKNGKEIESESYFSNNYDDGGNFIGYRVFNWLL